MHCLIASPKHSLLPTGCVNDPARNMDSRSDRGCVAVLPIVFRDLPGNDHTPRALVTSPLHFQQPQSRPLSELEELRWLPDNSPDENDELVRSSLARECKLSKVVAVKETRLAEVRA